MDSGRHPLANSTLELHQQQLIIDSHEAPPQIAQCGQCHKRKEEVKKLLTCKACGAAQYCSVECQKKHWPTHKPFCKSHRQALSEIQGWDRDALGDASGSSFPSPLPSVILAELQAFTTKFSPELLRAGFNALKLIIHPGAWEHHIIWIALERLQELPPDSQPWSRMQIKHVVACPTEILHTMWGKQPTARFLIQKRIQESQHMRNGYMGCITYSLSCRSWRSERIVHNTTFLGVGLLSVQEEDLRADWEDHFKATIERKCGRVPGSKDG